MGAPVKTQVKNGLRKLFNFRVHTIDVSDQAVFILKDSGLHNEEGDKTKVSNPLRTAQRRWGSFLSFMMTFHPDQDDPNCNYSCMTWRSCVQIPSYVDGIDSRIDTQMLKTSHAILVHVAALYNGIKPYIGTLKKYSGDIFK